MMRWPRKRVAVILDTPERYEINRMSALWSDKAFGLGSFLEAKLVY